MSGTYFRGCGNCWKTVRISDCLTCKSKEDTNVVEVQRKWSFAMESDTPYASLLDTRLEIKSLITIIGKTKKNCERFAINLLCSTKDDKEPDIAFHFNPRVSQRYVVRNSRFKGHWGTEETTSYRSFPFERDKQFRVDIFIAEELFFIQIDGKHFCSYSERTALNKINSMNVTGAVEVESVTFGEAQDYPVLEPSVNSIPDVAFLEDMNDDPPVQQWDPLLLANLPKGLPAGHQLVVRGRIHLLPHSFFINIQEAVRIWPRPTVMFHFNPRFNAENTKQVVVFNTRDKGDWGSEERTWSSRMLAGSELELVVCRGSERYCCWVRPWTEKIKASENNKGHLPEEEFSVESSNVEVEPQHTLIGSMPVRIANIPVTSIHIQGNFTVSQLFTCPVLAHLTETFQDDEYEY